MVLSTRRVPALHDFIHTAHLDTFAKVLSTRRVAALHDYLYTHTALDTFGLLRYTHQGSFDTAFLQDTAQGVPSVQDLRLVFLFSSL